MKNNALLKNLFIIFNHSKRTRRACIYALEKYATFFEMELDEFLREAESEESEGIKWKHRKNQIQTIGIQTVPD